MRKFILYPLLLLALFTLNACLDSIFEGESYTVSGRIYRDCSKTETLANARVILDVGKRPKDNIEVSTDANGYFSIQHNVSSREAILKVIYGNFSVVEIAYNLNLEEDNIIDQDFFLVNRGKLDIYLENTHLLGESDTLYYGTSQPSRGMWSFDSMIPPINEGYVVSFEENTSIFGGGYHTGNGVLLWGVGYEDYIKAVEQRLVGNSYHSIPFTLTGCEIVDKVIINLENP